MFQILGYRDSKGEFTDKSNPEKKIQFDNWAFSFLTDENSNYTGYATEKDGMRTISIPKKNLEALTGCKTPNEFVGKNVNLYYGMRYGRAVLTRVDEVK